MSEFIPGQRWMSESEPELGLGTVLRTANGRVEIDFPSAEERRTYASEHSPLKRVRFRIGDKIKTQTETEFVITDLVERDGILTYIVGQQRIRECELSDRLSLLGPQQRLFAGRFDDSATFELRRRTLELSHRSRQSPVRGFLGGRIDLIPHQLFIAKEVANRYAPRVLLSDEVGLGKTIEAGLIVHRLVLTGRSNRILLLVPESLIHQWFVEMLRRFNLWFNIFDEDRCLAIESGEPGANPFLEDQLVLAGLETIAQSPQRSAQAVAAAWDMLVVDEAHHLQWSEAAPSPQYQLVEMLSRRSEGVLLLTATPEQLGIESHFARLRLLDPDRYRDLETYRTESRDYQETADLAETLSSHEQLTERQLALVRRLLAHDPELEQLLLDLRTQDAAAWERLLEEILDLHGPGRVMFRNTRAAISGFPKRKARLARLHPGPEPEQCLDGLSLEFAADAGDDRLQTAFDLSKDARVLWLVSLLQQLDPDKVLLIARSADKAEAIAAALRTHVSLKTGLFHERLTLVQRDRNAAWFAEPDGARLLICSEIGSEGRNFQFAHHLVLFDLPLSPELLEQRIGRLDRIGQKMDIEIHVPSVARSPQEVLVRWYHEGLDAFESNLEGGQELLLEFGRAVHDLALEYPVAEAVSAEHELGDLVKRTAIRRKELAKILEQGRDRLLELNSFRPAVARKLIEQIQQADRQPDLEEYLLDMFEHFGVHIEELARHTWHLNPQGIITESFPAIPAEGMVATCDRQRALGREDVAFLTWDHPMVTGAIDLLLGTETGNCAFAVLPTPNERTLLLEAIFIVEAIAPAHLDIQRFLPSTPVRIVVNQRLEDVSEALGKSAIESRLQKGSPHKLIENEAIARRLLPAMIEKAEHLAHDRAVTLRQSALEQMNHQLGREVRRLKMLRQVNNHVRLQEIEIAAAQQTGLGVVIEQARLRLDCLRLIWKGPPEALSGDAHSN